MLLPIGCSGYYIRGEHQDDDEITFIFIKLILLTGSASKRCLLYIN